MKASIQICGTASNVGKSIIAASLCRIFAQDGFNVCPFKAQNMSLNSFVTKEGLEMGRAQVVQAMAAGLEPNVDMNPILLKPTSNIGAQVIVHGKAAANMTARLYQSRENKARLFKEVRHSLNRLRRKFDVLVIEGAGSPAEINLKANDIVNMKIAQLTKSPVILAGDIDKGGVFASLIGTMELLNKTERSRIKGFIINKFRGDKTLLKEGIRFLEKKGKVPVLGVIPYFKDIKIPQEDSVCLDYKEKKIPAKGHINMAVIRLPHISNFTDFDCLESEPDIKLSYIEEKQQLAGQDIIIIPGTKNTIEDLSWMRKKSIAQEINRLLKTQEALYAVIGICGGYQILGEQILDPLGIESRQKKIAGMGLLSVATTLERQKNLSQTTAIEIKSQIKARGYEIHHGKTRFLNAQIKPMFKMSCGFDGAISPDGRVWGTYLHGVFDNGDFRRQILNNIRRKKGLNLRSSTDVNLGAEFDKLAKLFRENVDMKMIYEIMNLPIINS